MTRKKAFFHLGNLLIAVSLFGFIYTMYPLVFIYLYPPNTVSLCHSSPSVEGGKLSAKARLRDSSATSENGHDCSGTEQKGFYISIPKIRAYSRVIENVNPWLESEYQKALKSGVAHAKNTSLPGKKGTIFLFAHSSGSPWEMTHTNTIFLRLNELNPGDEIILMYNGTLRTYKVKNKKEVWPQETEYLENTKKNQLILQTCTPIGTSLKRLLVFAEE